MLHNQPLCAATHCGLRGRHLDDCSEPDRCRGCLPRRAADGLRLCEIDTSRIGEDALKLAQLHEDLASALMRSGRGECITGSGDRSKAPSDEVMEARDDIRSVLTRLCRLISHERGISLPGGHVIRQLPREFIGPPNRVWCTAVDDLLAVARYVAKHREWLGAHRAAADHSRALRELAGDGHLWAMAYPSGSDRLYIGDCPLILRDLDGNESICDTRLYQLGDAPLLQCAGCGTDETVEWWQRQIVGDAHGEVDGYAAAAWLSLRWCRPVDSSLIRQWTSRGKVKPVMTPLLDAAGDPVLVAELHAGKQVMVPKLVPKRDERGRVIYDLTILRQHAESSWGPPVQLKRIAA